MGSLRLIYAEAHGQTAPRLCCGAGSRMESVWDYRALLLVNSDEHVLVTDDHRAIADSVRVLRILETASPPTYYIPAEDIDWDQLAEAPGSSFASGKVKPAISPWQLNPTSSWAGSTPIHQGRLPPYNHASFYPGRIRCEVNGEVVRPQAGEFYGGWITNRVVGFQGRPGPGTGSGRHRGTVRLNVLQLQLNSPYSMPPDESNHLCSCGCSRISND